jgi:Kdo2-lipid IVA 3' secondary acyltransferase
MAKKVIKQIKNSHVLAAMASIIGYALLRLLFLTYRIRVKNSLSYTEGIFWTWHQDIVATTAFFSQASLSPYFIVSGSKDGRLAGSILERLGNKVLYGSAHKNPIAVTRQALTILQTNKQLFIVGDGSRGPAKQLQGGPIFLAQKANIPLIFINCEVSKKIVLKKTWDKFQIPLPFSTITISLEKTCSS